MKIDKNIKLGQLTSVENKNKHKAANSSYLLAYLRGRFGSPVAYMFTTSQLEEARERAIRNSEDCLPLAKWWKIW